MGSARELRIRALGAPKPARLSLTLLLALIPVASAVSQANAEPSFTVIPPGPVARGARLDIRLAVQNSGDTKMPAEVAFFLEGESYSSKIVEQTILVPSRGKGLARSWYVADAPCGTYKIRYKLMTTSGERTGTWTVEIADCKTQALPYLQGMWIEPIAVLAGAADKKPETLRHVIKESVAAMDRLGVRMLIIAYVEYLGQFFYPSSIEFLDGDVQRTSKGPDCSFDIIDAFLSDADAHGMHVFLGIGRSGDTHLLWEFDKPDWSARNVRAIGIAKTVVRELWEKYSAHPSFYGWYMTHEMNDLARASAYYDPVALYCSELAPEKPILAAPSGTPVITPELLAGSAVDIFAYQDAVGAGYVPYKYTYDPKNRIAMLSEIYREYGAWHAKAGKHFWSDLEIWEMDGSQGYGGPYPATFSRVKQQIELECRHAQVLTGYSYHGYLQSPGALSEIPVARAQALYRDYADYVEGLTYCGTSQRQPAALR